MVAVVMSLYLLWLRNHMEGSHRRLGAGLAALVVGQLALGALNVALLAPVWMQVIHLLVADALWVVFVLFAIDGLAARQAQEAPV